MATSKRLSNERLADELGVSTGSVRRWRMAGMPEPPASGVTPAYRRRLDEWRRKTRRKSGAPPLHGRHAGMVSALDQVVLEERAKRERLRTEREQIELDQLRGDLHSRSECEDRRAAQILAAREVLMSISARAAGRFPDVAGLFEWVDDEIRRALGRLAEG